MNKVEEFFYENYLFTREDILKSLELYVEYLELNEENEYSKEIAKNRVKLCKKFITAVKKCKLPDLTELWWFYNYDFLGNGLQLNLCQGDDIEFENDEISGMTLSTVQILIKVPCDYLTVDQYASMLGVEPAAVARWINRGKFRYAIKNGNDWMIPSIEDIPQSKFNCVQYIFEDGAQIYSDEFPLISSCESISIMQDQKNKREFHCYFENFKTRLYNKLNLTRREVERLEYVIIESGKAKVEGEIQYIPHLVKS